MKLGLLLFLIAVLPTSAIPLQSQMSVTPAAQQQALPFIKTTAVVFDHVRHRSLNDYRALYVSDADWDSASRDSWIGAFFRIKYVKSKPGRSAACVISPDKDIALCVYFDGETPIGLATIRVPVSGMVEPYRVASSYEGLARKLLRPSEQKLDFLPTTASTDDGRALPAFELRKQ